MTYPFPVVLRKEMRIAVFLKMRNYYLMFFEMKNGHKYSVLLNGGKSFCLDIGYVIEAEKDLEKDFKLMMIEDMLAFGYKHEHSQPL